MSGVLLYPQEVKDLSEMLDEYNRTSFGDSYVSAGRIEITFSGEDLPYAIAEFDADIDSWTVRAGRR